MLEFLGDVGNAIMSPLYWVVSAILVGFHNVLSMVLPSASGASWVLSIVGLTLVIRAALIPLFVKQIKSSRNMQLIQPQVKELQKKYGHDRERLAQETMNLYRETGTNPFSACLPILIQMPIFFALFRLLDQASRHGHGHGLLSDAEATVFADAELFGVQISRTFMNAAGDVGVMVLAALLVIAMTATTFLTQRQLMSKNMPPDALTGPYAQQQKLLLYVLPVVFAVGGVAFPIGVLVYWTTSNLWTMGQQFYVIRRNPAPGTPAYAAKAERDARKARRHGHPVEAEPGAGGTAVATADPDPEPPRPAQRDQPKRQSRSERSGQQPQRAGPRPGAKPPTKKKSKKRR